MMRSIGLVHEHVDTRATAGIEPGTWAQHRDEHGSGHGAGHGHTHGHEYEHGHGHGPNNESETQMTAMYKVLFLVRWVWFSSFAARLDDMQNDTASDMVSR